MGRKKKNKKAIIQRKNQKQQKKRKLTKARPKYSQASAVLERPPVAEMEAPEGFISINMSNAVMEYAAPLLEKQKSKADEDLNKALNTAMMIWNHAIEGPQGERRPPEKEVLKSIRKSFKINDGEAKELLEMMLKRKEYLFPEDIQPQGGIFMYMRKTKQYTIAEFDYNAVQLNDRTYNLEEADKLILQSIQELDKYIFADAEIDQWEDFYYETLDEIKKRFTCWLDFKGLSDYKGDFPFYIEIFLNFIYMYGHDRITTLNKVSLDEFEEFFFDYVLRKVIVEPEEYVAWPPALKLFYEFLKDVGYMKAVTKPVRLITLIEPYFLKVLRKRYS